MPAPNKRYHTEETMRAAVAFFEQGKSLADVKKGDDNPVQILNEVVAEVLERRAVWEKFKNTLIQWVNEFKAR